MASSHGPCNDLHATSAEFALAGSQPHPITTNGITNAEENLEQWRSRLHKLIAMELDVPGTHAESTPPVSTAAASHPAVALQRKLSEQDQAQLDQVEKQYRQAFLSVANEESRAAAQKGYDVNFFAVRSRLVVASLRQFAGQLPEFAALPNNMQTSLLKAGCTSSILLRFAQLFNPADERWNDGHGGTFDLTGLVRATGGESSLVWARHAELCRQFRQLVPERSAGCTDTAIYALLQAIMIMSPERGVCECHHGRDAFAEVSDGQLHYTLLLRRYLEAHYSFARTAELLPALLNGVAEYKRHAVHFRDALMTCAEFRDVPEFMELL